jgi:inosose dehydratase
VQGPYATFGAGEVLANIAGAGFAATEAGPVGFLGRGATLRTRLDDAGLELAGIFWLLQTQLPDELREGLVQLDQLLGELVASELRETWLLLAVARPGARAKRPLERTRGDWGRILDGLARAEELVRSFGMRAAVHHHFGSEIETVPDIEHLLATTSLPLLLDTGHLALAGGSCVDALRDWGSRIDYVHLKDARSAACTELAARSGGMPEIWRRGVFCELGQGDLPLDQLLAALVDRDYSGWIAIEQDRFIPAAVTAREIADAQARNLEWLTSHISLEELTNNPDDAGRPKPG